MYSNRWAYTANERYEATGARHNPAYIHDDDTDTVYKYNGRYNQKEFPDSHHRSFSAISHGIEGKKPRKEAKSLLAPACVGATFLAIALVIGGAVVIAIMTVIVKDDVIYPDVLVVGESSTKGEITLSNTTWNSTFEDSSSEQYKLLESQFIAEMDKTYQRSNLADVYNHTTVEQFRQGSIIVVFVVYLNGATPSAKQIQVQDDTEQLQAEVEKATFSDVLSVLNSETGDSLLGELPVGEASVTEVVSVTIEVEVGNSENQPPEAEPPSVICPADITQNTDDESPTAVVSWEEPLAEDNSGVIDRVESQPESGSEFMIGETEVTVLAYDAVGNIGVCTFTVTVIDEERPSVNCPSNVTENVSDSEATKVVTWPPPEATDNSEEDLYIYTTPVSGHAFPIGVTPVEVAVSDLSGNSVTCTFFVNILDNVRPVVTCPADVDVDTDPGQSTGSVTWSSPNATDNSGQSVSLSSDSQPGNYGIGHHVVTYTGEDESGNTAQCSFSVTVTDNERPVVTCPANIAVDTDPGQSTGSVMWSSPTATDNSGQNVSLSSDSQPGDYEIGGHVVTYTGEDKSGNTAQCSFNVTVTDNEPPVMSCPSDIYNKTQMGELSGYITWTIPPPTDNSGDLVTYETDYQPGEFPVGSYTVNATATDVYGNTAWCTFMFVVEPLCHPEFCLNEGNCSFSPMDNAYVCQCPVGFLGKNCEFEVPDPDACGTNPLFPSTRIVGGEIAYPGSWPWQVFMDYRVYRCGAILITNQWILTAAHCVGDPGARANLNAIILGEVHLTNESVSRVNRSVERIFVHPGYQSIVIDNDIALIQLTEPVEFDDFVRPACLPSNSSISEEDYYSKCYATGWGKTDGYGDISMRLLQAQVPLINRTVCDQKLKALGSASITENMICAGIDEKSTCQGDSGGPLVCQEADGRWTLVGITSWGYQCGDPESPSVFVRVSKYLEYIESVIQGVLTDPVLSCEPVNSGCQMNVPYTETFTTSQSQIEYYVDNLYRDVSPYLDHSVCDVDGLNATICSFFFKGCDQAIVPCRQYCESVLLPCLQYNDYCTFLPYGPPGEQWCIEGRDYCGEQDIKLSEDSSVILKNPFFGNNNVANRDCIWLITGPVGYNIVVRVQFLSIGIYTHTLSVGHGRDPERRSSTIVKFYDQTQLVLVEDHEGWIRLETNNEMSYVGFSALLTVTDREHGTFPCVEDSLVCSNLCLPMDWLCDGIRDCQAGEDEANCTVTDYPVDVFLTEDEPNYFFSSPGYPQYPPNLNATWLFTCPEGFVIRITFLMVDTQTCCDIIEVSDDSGQSLLRWSGYTQNEQLSVTSRGNMLLVSFQTNDFAEFSGFAADVELLNYTSDDVFDCDERFDCGQGVCIPFSGVCNDVINCVEGVDEKCSESIFVNSSYTFNSPNFPAKYPNDFEYTWYFYTYPGLQLFITFSSIATEPDFDYIYVREGGNISAISDLLLRWSGTGSSDGLRILSSGNIIQVTFESDGSFAYNGFVATVEVTNVTREELNCGTEFYCDNGVCLPQSKVCDGRRECGNNADETNGKCTGTCGPSEVSCYDGDCIDWFSVCDGYPDCYGGEDESWCNGTDTCSPSDFSCYDGSCIPGNLTCDGVQDCSLGEDEFWCNATYTCSPSDFSCYDGSCIPGNLTCDGNPDCFWGEDESWCNRTDCSFSCNNMTCISSSLLCDGINDCDEGEDEGIDTCGGDVFLNRDNQMYLVSPNYPNGYPDNFNVSWKISTHQGYVLQVKFISFQTEYSYDFITIDEFDDITFTQLIKKWSGSDTSLLVSTSTHQMRVNFYSDSFINDKGFQGIITSVPGNATSSCPASYFDCGNGACFSMEAGCDKEVNCGNDADAELCSGNPNRCNLTQFNCGDVCIENELVCDGRDHCINSEDETSFCDEVVYIPENMALNITSPDYPSPYPESSNNTWYFRTDPGVQILVYFLSFSTEESYDFVTIGDGLQVSSHLLIEWSGLDPSVSILSTSNHLWFNFQSDELFNYDGFEAVAYAVKLASNDTLECEDYQFSCSGSVCLPSSAVCDGIISCGSGEDEENCIDIPTTVEDPTTIFGPSPHVMTTIFGPSPHVVTTTSQTTTLPGVSAYPSGNTSRCDLTEFSCGDICIKNELVCDGMFDCPEFADEMICDRVLYISENTALNITSPDYPSPYPDSSNHTWYFRTDPGVQILVYFLSFSTEESYDFVTIGDGLQVSSHLLLEWSGFDSSVSILSTSSHLWFNFQSDESFNYDGFEAVAYAVKVPANDSLECEDYQFSCSGSVCLPSYAVCDDVISCGSGQDETNCTGTACPDDFFQCSDGICFSSLLLCDGIAHCTDGGDEAASLCANETDSDQCTSVPSYCQQYLPYNNTKFPHQFASDITDAEDLFWKLMPFLSCHDNATAFVCAALYPDCQDIGVIVEPCNTTCFEVVQSCEPVYFNGTEELWPFTCFHYGNYYRQAENGYCLAVRYLVSVSGSILMNQTFSEELLDRNSDAYQSLAVQFITECDSLFSSSFVLDNSYLGTKIDGFSAGSVHISFRVFLNQLVDGDATLTGTAIHITMEDAIDFQTHFQSLPLLSDTLTTHPASIMDNVPPRVMSCPDNIAVEAGNEELVLVSWEEPLVSDNSGSWILEEFSPSTSLFQVDTVTDVLYVFEDPSGNQARCEFTVAVLPPSCNPVYVDLSEGQVVNISSPFYPQDFPREIICYWNFTSPAGLVVLIEFDVFQMGGAQLITSVGNLSGFQIPAPLISSTSQSSIIFSSTNGQFTYPGFHATVKAVNATYYSDVFCDNGGQVLLLEQLFCDGTDHCLDASDEKNCECTEEDFICYDSNRCIQSFQVCNGMRDCPLRDDEINCHPNCSAENITLMSNQSMLIQSTNFPGFYFPNMECAWIVTAPENHSIIIRTSFLEIGEEDSITIGRGQNALNTSNTICEIKSNDIRDVAVDERFAWIRFSSGPEEVTTEGFLLEVVALSQRDFQKETFQCYSGQSIIKSEVCNGVNDCPDFADEDGCPPCVDVSLTDCQLLLPYQQTIFPHPLAISPDEASTYFSSLSFLTGCHSSINILLCSVLFPDCPHTGPVTRPCQSFCLNVTNSCKALYEETLALSWPINCDNYDDNLPVGDDGFCNGGDDDVFNTEICGTRPAAPVRGRIVGGTGASFGDWPWIASLRDDYGDHQCGATLITERWAITAAHCIGYVSSAIFGDLYLSTPSSYHHETTFNTHTHPQYNPYTKEHDIALLELKKPVNFTDYVRPSCLSTLSNETDVYQRCYIAGWGHLMYEASTVPNRLQEALTHLFTAEECLNYISSNYKEDTMLCAGYDEGGIDTCQGDSGGPLVCEGTDGRWHLVGLTSFGFACALPRLPGVYTRISQHIDFIKSHVG
ncbi:Ovochymase-1 [Holothuria leucospilota]|uniref:Ovochymase-1 n=1 Tax=Holothuria leucospilota TaxID=206669 RepID=A0A9Q0YEQ0_HOLLE|nr:Ovochymase-1 [Holothuria leucospilota]